MGIMKKLACFVILLFAANSYAANYDIERTSDGPFSFFDMGIMLNEGSSLQRESILFNDKSSPVKLLSHTMKVKYKDRGFRFAGSTRVQIGKKITALQIRTIQYDIFGRHMQNLANTEPKDFSVGEITVDGEWRASEHEITEFLTSVTYVARVRFEDGTQWVFNSDNLQMALSTLHLEKKIGEDETKK